MRFVIVNGFPNYKIREDGSVWSVPRIDRYNRKHGGIFLKPKPDPQGYLQVSLLKCGRTYYRRIHRLVAEHFIDGYKSGVHVNHIIPDKNNNSVTNLEICSPRKNINHRESVVFKKKRWGVFLIKPKSKKSAQYWVAKIRVKGKQIQLGKSLHDKEMLFELYREAYKNIWGEYPW